MGSDGLHEIEFLAGEVLELALDLKDGLLEEPRAGGDLLVLTNRRIAYLNGGQVHRGAAFAMLEDVSAVEVRRSERGMSALAWGVGAIMVGLALWQTVNNDTLSVLLGVVLGAMGVYLIGDWLWLGEKATIVIQAGAAQIQRPLMGSGAARDIHAFINKFFHLKALSSNRRGYRRPFPPRDLV